MSQPNAANQPTAAHQAPHRHHPQFTGPPSKAGTHFDGHCPSVPWSKAAASQKSHPYSPNIKALFHRQHYRPIISRHPGQEPLGREKRTITHKRLINTIIRNATSFYSWLQYCSTTSLRTAGERKSNAANTIQKNRTAHIHTEKDYRGDSKVNTPCSTTTTRNSPH